MYRKPLPRILIVDDEPANLKVMKQVLQELPRCLAIRFVHQLSDRELAGPVDAYEEMELALDCLNLGNIDMEEADGVALELLPLWFVTLDIRQARNPTPLQAPVQC